MIKPQTLKGFRDFLPQEARKRHYVIDTLKKVFISYGFEPLETPVLEYEELLTGKYGDEGDKLMYRFTDNGDRRVAMRYDQTVPLARVVAQYQNNLSFPFKRYQVQPVWRAENTQKGRFREFLQCDIDSVGSSSPLADAEILSLVATSFEALGFPKFTILINDRKLFEGLPIQAVIAIDKLKKIGSEKVKEELKKLNLPGSLLDEITSKQPTENLEEIMKVAQDLGLPKTALQFDPTLARGLDYYTGMIIEVVIDGYTAGSVGGGGRYDNLIGLFAGKQIPAVGFAFGFDRIMDAMEEKGLFPSSITRPTSQVLVTLFSEKTTPTALKTLTRLRKEAIPAELYIGNQTSLDKQLKYANTKSIPFVCIIGEDEITKNVVTIKNMQTREQQTVSLDKAVQLLKPTSR